jgi:hypothetical protein
MMADCNHEAEILSTANSLVCGAVAAATWRTRPRVRQTSSIVAAFWLLLASNSMSDVGSWLLKTWNLACKKSKFEILSAANSSGHSALCHVEPSRLPSSSFYAKVWIPLSIFP